MHEDKRLFEFLILEGAQAGLSWLTILRKRENYRNMFDNFDPVKVSKYSGARISRILQNASIVRNRLKIGAAVENAKKFLIVQKEFESFDKYIWRFSKKPAKIDCRKIPVTTPESDAMSADLKKRGFKFVGSTICYSFMQATGLVNDHDVSCFRFNEIEKKL